VAVDISTEALEKPYVDLCKPENLLTVKTDISSEEGTKQLFDQIKDKWNAIDIIINKTGWFPFLEFDKISYADWRKVMGINLDGIPDYQKFTTTIETERCRAHHQYCFRLFL
jgi:NAD(P)-dependent dehydrogenase (short-subunit alcohol dehydrogenase family)